MTLSNSIHPIKYPFLLFFILYFIIFASLAAKSNTEQDIYKRYQDIRSDDAMPHQKKDKLLNQLLNQAVSFKNPLYNALIISRLHNSAKLKVGKTESRKWQIKYNQALSLISSEKSQQALKILANNGHIHALQNEQKHIAALKIVLDSFHKIKNIKSQKKESIINGQIYITELDIAELNNLAGISYFSMGDYDNAQKYFFTSLHLFEELNALKGITATLNNLSLISWAQKDFIAALKYLERPLAISQQFDNSSNYITYIANHGVYYTELKQFDNAIVSYKKAINHPQSKLFY